MSSFTMIRADAAVYTSIAIGESPAGKGRDKRESRKKTCG